MALRRTLACFFLFEAIFLFHCVCLTLNLMSQSEPGWELITQAAHYSLPGIKYAACPWTWYSLSLSLLCEPVSISVSKFFFFFLSKGEHPHKPPLPHTFPHLAWQFPQLSRNRLSDIDTEGEPASSVWTFLLVFSFFFLLSAFGVYNRVAPTT